MRRTSSTTQTQMWWPSPGTTTTPKNGSEADARRVPNSKHRTMNVSEKEMKTYSRFKRTQPFDDTQNNEIHLGKTRIATKWRRL